MPSPIGIFDRLLSYNDPNTSRISQMKNKHLKLLAVKLGAMVISICLVTLFSYFSITYFDAWLTAGGTGFVKTIFWINISILDISVLLVMYNAVFNVDLSHRIGAKRALRRAFKAAFLMTVVVSISEASHSYGILVPVLFVGGIFVAGAYMLNFALSYIDDCYRDISFELARSIYMKDDN